MSQSEKKSPEEVIAELKARAENEPIARFLGMKLLALEPGYSKVSIKVLPEHQNFNHFTFGGIIGAVADQAFAYGSNSLAFPSVASQFNLHFIAGANTGDELIAECRVVKNGARVGISEITVTDQKDRLIARATGTTIPIDSR